MKRLAGLIASAVVLALVSLLQVVMALLMVVAAEIKPRQALAGANPGAPAVPPPPAWMPMMMWGMGAFFLALAVWGIWTAIGLHRLRRWARTSVLIIGGGMAMIGLLSMLSMLVLMVVPLPGAPGIDPARAQTTHVMVKVVGGFIALVYAAVAAVGIWWLVYFNRQQVRALFLNAQGEMKESRRPLLVSLLAVLILAGAPSCLLMAFLPFPAPLFGFIFRGWEKVLLCVLYAALNGSAGVGLWQMKEWGRRLTLGVMAIGFVNTLIFLLRPSLMASSMAEVSKAWNLPPAQQMGGPMQSTFLKFEMVPSILIFILIAAMLHYYRRKFSEPLEPAPVEAGPAA